MHKILGQKRNNIEKNILYQSSVHRDYNLEVIAKTSKITAILK